MNEVVYSKSAIFICSSCAYATTIYSDKEWLSVVEALSCETCKGDCDRSSEQAEIFRDDIVEDHPLHMQFASMPRGKSRCDNCPHLNNQLHWTELLVHCHHCKLDSMHFTEYTEGKNMLLFKKECLDNSKPAHPMMEWIDGNGNRIFDISGPGRNLSAS